MEEKIKEKNQAIETLFFSAFETGRNGDTTRTFKEWFQENNILERATSLLRPSEVSEGDRTSYFVKELENNINNNLQYRDRDWFDLGINYALSLNGEECVKFGEWIAKGEYIYSECFNAAGWIHTDKYPPDDSEINIYKASEHMLTTEQLFTGPYKEYKLKQQKQNG